MTEPQRRFRYQRFVLKHVPRRWARFKNWLDDQWNRPWYINKLAATELAKEMGVAFPVIIEANPTMHKRPNPVGQGPPPRGLHWRDEHGTHFISMRSVLGPHEASRILRHELRHCVQAETDPRFTARYHAMVIQHGYSDNLYEVEARGSELDYPHIRAIRFRHWPYYPRTKWTIS